MPEANIPMLNGGATAYGQIGSLLRGLRNCVGRRDVTGATVQSDQINVTGAENSATYVIRFTSSNAERDGYYVEITATTDSSSSQTELRDAIKAAADDSPNLFTLISSIVVGTNLLTVTWLDGQTGTITFPTNPTTDLTLTSLATAAAAPQYYYGRAVEIRDLATQLAAEYGEGIRVATFAGGGTVTLTIVHDAGDTYTVAGNYVNAAGVSSTFSVDFAAGADLAAAVANAITALETEFPLADATSPGAGVVLLTMEPGARVWGVTGVSDDAGTVTPSAETAGTLPKFALVALDNSTPLPDTYPTPAQPVGPDIGAMVQTADPLDGSAHYIVAVDTSESISRGDAVYVETTAGATLGRLYNTQTASRIPWPQAKWVGVDPSFPARGVIAL